MLSPASQVLVRNESLFEQGHWLLCNPADVFVFQKLSAEKLSGFHQYFDRYQQARNLPGSQDHQFGAEYKSHVELDGAVIYLPKSKEQAKMLIANMASVIKKGGQLLIVGENKAGIKSAAKLLEPFSEQVNKIDSARHCSLFCAQLKTHVPPFKLASWQKTWAVDLNGVSYEVVSLPGVFSHKELDAGTRLLLENTRDVPAGKILDFACGAGVIGCYLGKVRPDLDLVMSDVSALAIYSAKASADKNELNCQVIASDGLTEITDKFSAIYTNPPFHTGIDTDYSITQRFIGEVKQHLNTGGQLHLVANRFLKYPQALQENLHKVEVKAKTNKFTLYSAHA